MVTTNMPELMQQLTLITDAHIHDTGDRLELTVPKNADMQQVDDLLCDAVFAEPEQRLSTANGWLIHLNKLPRPRPMVSDMRVVHTSNGWRYELGIA